MPGASKDPEDGSSRNTNRMPGLFLGWLLTSNDGGKDSMTGTKQVSILNQIQRLQLRLTETDGCTILKYQCAFCFVLRGTSGVQENREEADLQKIFVMCFARRVKRIWIKKKIGLVNL